MYILCVCIYVLYVYMCVYIYIYMYTHVCVCIYMYTHIFRRSPKLCPLAGLACGVGDADRGISRPTSFVGP